MFAAGMHVPVRQPAARAPARPRHRRGRHRRGARCRRRLGRRPVDVSRTPGSTRSSWRAPRPRCSSLARRGGASRPLRGLVVAAQVAVADVAAIVLVPIVLQPSRTPHALAAPSRSRPAPSSCSSSRAGRGTPHGSGACDGSRRSANGRSTCASRCSCCSGSLARDADRHEHPGRRFASGSSSRRPAARSGSRARSPGSASGFFVPLFFVVLGARIDVARSRRAAR